MFESGQPEREREIENLGLTHFTVGKQEAQWREPWSSDYGRRLMFQRT